MYTITDQMEGLIRNAYRIRAQQMFSKTPEAMIGKMVAGMPMPPAEFVATILRQLGNPTDEMSLRNVASVCAPTPSLSTPLASARSWLTLI